MDFDIFWPEMTEALKTFHPSNVLVTGFDIIFFWVARMIMLTLHFMDDVPFKTVYVHGLVRDSHGQKMSKSKGNVLDPIGLLGKLPKTMSGDEFAAYIESKLGRKPLHIAGSDCPISRVAWCSGAAQGMIDQAVELGADAYLTGEVSEPTVHSAREQGIHFYAAGHHATERGWIRRRSHP